MRVQLKKKTSWSTTSDFFIYIRTQELHKENKQSNNHTHTKLTVPPFGSDEEKDNEIQLLKKKHEQKLNFFQNLLWRFIYLYQYRVVDRFHTPRGAA